jgi:hypothetical protein
MGASQVSYEAGQTAQPFEALTDSGDRTIFEASFSPLSRKAGYEPVVAPYGLVTGGAITPNAGTDDSVSVAALTAMMPGATGANASTGIVAVSAGNVAVSRGVSTDTHRITSITVNSSGALAAVAGVDGTAFSETRGADGGPPLIPDGSIEIGQVRTTSVTAADVTAGEIYQVVGTHQERSDYPPHAINYATGEVTFSAALPAIHTGNIPKQVHLRGYTPIFAPIPYSTDWTPAEATYSISSTATYDGPVGSSSSSLGQASFTVFNLTDGISDSFLSQKGQEIWVKFNPDRDQTTKYQLTLGIMGVSRTFSADGSKSASVTVTPRTETTDVAA